MQRNNIGESLRRIEELLVSQSMKPMTLDEAASYLHISKSYLYRLTSKSLIPHYKPGGKKIFFDKNDLDHYILRNRVRSVEEIREGFKEKKYTKLAGKNVLTNER
ncbi:MAG TPA: helix-turn-helix domain-containing protein [Bacteroidota bacterium]|nr:helix-turn-helix domain-containing protein [Bacteroidota bacterium]